MSYDNTWIVVNITRPKSYWDAAIAQWICLRLPSVATGSCPKHTIYAFIIYNQMCDIFVIALEERK